MGALRHITAEGDQVKAKIKLPNTAYVVGWICAIPTEYNAARVFLDDEHEKPDDVSSNDNNGYTLGQIGKHNVVITLLPKEYGTSSAAAVARDMVHTFTNIRIGLMVGIGGGAPSEEHDIRLGDVVVSEHDNRYGGIYRYDFVKAIQGQPSQEIGFLGQPPPALRAAVEQLKADYEFKGHKIQKAIKDALEANPRLRKRFQQPDISTDRLYRPDITHLAGRKVSCAESCGADPSSLILRDSRDEGEDSPMIHHGLIASGNSLMKDATRRDELARDKGVLCFEMEASGLMNHFPCLVIRGICDYSDTHKNDAWQGYAAMTAAAYAKDVLGQISQNKVEAERAWGEMIGEGESFQKCSPK